MTPSKEDIIRMAQQVKAEGFAPVGIRPEVIRLCELVVAAERNKVAQWAMSRGYTTGHGDTVEDLLKELEWQVAERERETCAQVCDGIAASKECQTGDLPEPAEDCAAAIRARGQDPMPLFDDWGCPPCNQNCDQGRRCPNARVNR